MRLLAIPQPWLYGGILVFSTLGVLSLTGQAFDLGLLFALGLLGFVMRRLEVPIAPAIVGLILGPLCEEQFRRALSISRGEYLVFLERPISATFLALALLALVVPLLLRWRRA